MTTVAETKMSLEDLAKLAEGIDDDQSFAFTAPVSGQSMVPFLFPGDQVRIRVHPEGGIFVGCIVAFRTANGCFLVHRVVHVARDGFGRERIITLGDGRKTVDKAVGTDAVLGVVTARIRQGMTISLDSKLRYMQGVAIAFRHYAHVRLRRMVKRSLKRALILMRVRSST